MGFHRPIIPRYILPLVRKNDDLVIALIHPSLKTSAHPDMREKEWTGVEMKVELLPRKTGSEIVNNDEEIKKKKNELDSKTTEYKAGENEA